MKDYLWAIAAVTCFFSAQTSVSLAGGCCKRCAQDCRGHYVPHCCHHCGCNSSPPPAPESARRESAPRPRSTGYVVESAPMMTYGMMAIPLALGVPTVPASYRPESAYRRESDTERVCEQLSKDVSKLSEEVDKLIKVVDKQGLAIEAIVKKLQEKNVLEK